ncbi:MAG: type II toxin-antitoxin system VapC family toxin [Betaproteobacteria bacterium]
MPAGVLVDTGAFAALANPRDPYHAAAKEWFREFSGELLTTDAVITETAYVLRSSVALQQAALVSIERGRAAGFLRIEPVASYEAVADIMAKYSALPCDFADATLIELAERIGVATIATIDERDFSVYRLRGGKRFRIVLDPRTAPR